jgi:ankyrin repeat protein
VNTSDANGSSALWVAAQNGFADVVQVLLDAKADLESKDDSEQLSPLGIASYSGKMDVVNVLLAASANTESTDKTGATPIWLAAQQGHGDVVAALIKGGAKVDATSDAVGGITPLFIAAHAGHISTVDNLLQAGADPHLATVKGGTPLIAAARAGHILIACKLLLHGVPEDQSAAIPPKTVQQCSWILENIKDETNISAIQLQVVAAELRLRSHILRQDNVGMLRDTARLIQLVPKLGRSNPKQELSKLYSIRARVNFGLEKWANAAEDAFFAIQNDSSVERAHLLQDYLILVKSYVGLSAVTDARLHATDALRLAADVAERDYLMAILDKAYLESSSSRSNTDGPTGGRGLPTLQIDLTISTSLQTKLSGSVMNSLTQDFQHAQAESAAAASGGSNSPLPPTTAGSSSMSLPQPSVVNTPDPKPKSGAQHNVLSAPTTPAKSPSAESLASPKSAEQQSQAPLTPSQQQQTQQLVEPPVSSHTRRASGDANKSETPSSLSSDSIGGGGHSRMAASAPALSLAAINAAKEKEKDKDKDKEKDKIDKDGNKKNKLSFFFSAFRWSKSGKEKEKAEKAEKSDKSEKSDKAGKESDKLPLSPTATDQGKSKPRITLQLPPKDDVDTAETSVDATISPRTAEKDDAIDVYLDYYISDSDDAGGGGGEGEFDPVPQMPDDEESTGPGHSSKISPRRGQSFRGAPGYSDLLRQADILKRRVQTADAQVKDAESRAAAQAAHFDRKLKELTQRLIETEVVKSELEARLKALNANPDLLIAQQEGAPSLTETAAQNLDLKRQVAELQLKLAGSAEKDAKIQILSHQIAQAEKQVQLAQQTAASSNEIAALKKQVGDLERRLKHNADHFNAQLKVFIGINSQYEKENSDLRRQLADVGVQLSASPIPQEQQSRMADLKDILVQSPKTRQPSGSQSSSTADQVQPSSSQSRFQAKPAKDDDAGGAFPLS